MISVQNNIDRSLSEVEALRRQYDDHMHMCQKNHQMDDYDQGLLQRDLPIAQEITTRALAGCSSGGAVPAMVECSLPDGSFVTTFKDEAERAEIARLSSISEKIVAMNLDRSIHGGGAGALFLAELQTHVGHAGFQNDTKHHARHANKGRSHKHSHGKHSKHTGTFLQRMLTREHVPAEMCSDVQETPACEAFTDTMNTVVGNIQDLMTELKQKSQLEQEQCDHSLVGYDNQIKDLKRQADDAGVSLANSAAQEGDLFALRRERRQQKADLASEVNQELGMCTQGVGDLHRMISGTKRIKNAMDEALGSDSGSFMGDCEVSPWTSGPCSEICGTNGTQNLTRFVIISPETDPRCPALQMSRACNRRPCPIDAIMGAWQEWSQCSRSCGKGTRTRHRDVIRHEAYAGVPAAETTQEEICNPQPCDGDCRLSEWTGWSNCSKVCSLGHQMRTRQVVSPPFGDGMCPPEDSSDRRQTETCNPVACNSPYRCTSELDLVLVLDASGTVGSQGWEHLKSFVSILASRMDLGDSDGAARLGIVKYGSSATTSLPLTGDSASISAAIPGMAWNGDNTNTAQGLALAAQMLEDQGDPDVQQVVVVVTDGMPLSTYLTTVEVDRLKANGVRIVFVSIGNALSHHALQKWASWPYEENIVTARASQELGDTSHALDKVTELIANICSDAEPMES